jgi:ribosomal-protein-alanine N-acetyltransferase
MHDLSADPPPGADVRDGEPLTPRRYWIDRLDGEQDLDGVLEVEAESFTNPWTREMYAWELQNRSVCHIYVVRMSDCHVAAFCAFWLVFDEIHINNVAVRPQFRGRGIGTALMHHVLAESRQLGAKRATLEVRASNDPARRLYERLGFYVAATRRNYYTNPVEDALILWRDDRT